MPIQVPSTSTNYPTSTADIEARWRTLTAAETPNASALLDDAWAMLTSRRPQLPDNLATGAVNEQNVVRVMCAMVLRVLKNPSGYLEETIDDWTGRRDSLVSSGILHVTPEELADVSPGRKGARSVRMVANGDA